METRSEYRQPAIDSNAPLSNAYALPSSSSAGGFNWHWLPTLFADLFLFVVFAIVLFVTGNPNLYPTVTLIGNGLVPVVFVAFLYDHQHVSTITTGTLARALLLGGLLGTLGASILEPILVPAPTSPDQGLTLSAAR